MSLVSNNNHETSYKIWSLDNSSYIVVSPSTLIELANSLNSEYSQIRTIERALKYMGEGYGYQIVKYDSSTLDTTL